ncbi:WG repeat-containing protein [uncultured Murdochiella sp.]|uniref:WG repeat-containing protein n=1 Tax=uncultured Murdochiella sp. TaxID=1586095 RepID=UPI0028042D40|nr:WG repeat-containing protein [uncultured Murdochiella sp.]
MHFGKKGKNKGSNRTKQERHHFLSPVLFCRIYAVLLFLCIAGIFLFQKQQEAQRNRKRQYCREQAKMLVDAGFYGEAQKQINAMPKPLSSEDVQLLFRAAVKKQDFRSARKLLSLLPEEQKETSCLTLIDALKKDGKSVLAWEIVCRSWSSLKTTQQKELAISLLQDVQEIPTHASFISGWINNRVAVLKDDDGLFLVNAQGEEISNVRYESILPTAEGFSARRNNIWVSLNIEGEFLHTVKEPTEKEIIQAESSFLVSPTKGDGQQGYTFSGEEVIKPIYDRASPISMNGVGYVETEGRFWQIRFRALRDGVSFNKIDS